MIVVAPVTATVPLSVIALFVLFAVSVPDIVLAPKSIAAFSVMEALVPVNAKEPNALEASSKVIFAVPAFKVVVPVVVTVPISVISLLVVVTVKLVALSDGNANAALLMKVLSPEPVNVVLETTMSVVESKVIAPVV